MHPPTYDNFKLLATEIEQFIKCDDKENFKSADMFDYGNGEDVTAMYNVAWRILNPTTGETKTVHHTKHSLTIIVSKIVKILILNCLFVEVKKCMICSCLLMVQYLYLFLQLIL